MKILLRLCLTLMVLFSAATARAGNDVIKVTDSTNEVNEALRVFFSDPQAADVIPLLSMSLEGGGNEKDLADLVNSTRDAAQKGDTKAKVRLSMMYTMGIGVDRNDVEAFTWVSSAAGDGNWLAEWVLAGMYDKGRGIRQSRIEGAKWMKKEKEHGAPLADRALNATGKNEWRKRDGAFEAVLGLFHRSATQIPSQNRAPNGDVENGRLVLAPGETADAFIKYINCSQEGSGGCSEVIDAAVFGPDWTMVREIRGFNLRKDPALPGKDGYTFADAWLSLSADDSDTPGVYHLLVDIYDGKQKLRVGLTTAFSVAKRVEGTSEAGIGTSEDEIMDK